MKKKLSRVCKSFIVVCLEEKKDFAKRLDGSKFLIKKGLMPNLKHVNLDQYCINLFVIQSIKVRKLLSGVKTQYNSCLNISITFYSLNVNLEMNGVQ